MYSITGTEKYSSTVLLGLGNMRNIYVVKNTYVLNAHLLNILGPLTLKNIAEQYIQQFHEALRAIRLKTMLSKCQEHMLL